MQQYDRRSETNRDCKRKANGKQLLDEINHLVTHHQLEDDGKAEEEGGEEAQEGGGQGEPMSAEELVKILEGWLAERWVLRQYALSHGRELKVRRGGRLVLARIQEAN